jgi:hypothetical protein
MRGRDRQRILRDCPSCIYCGGLRAAVEVDHFPPMQLFQDRRRPKGLEGPSCTECNRGSREAESLASFLSCIRFDQTSEAQTQHFSEQIRHMMNNYPEVYRALKPNVQQRIDVQKLSFKTGQNLEALDLTNPRVYRALLLFGAKCGLALHWHETKQILPVAGNVGVILISNEQAFNGQVPRHLFDLLPEPRTLSQGSWNVEEQFSYASKRTVDGDSTAHWAIFGHAFSFNLFVGVGLKLAVLPAENVFSPGCLAIGQSTA